MMRASLRVAFAWMFLLVAGSASAQRAEPSALSVRVVAVGARGERSVAELDRILPDLESRLSRCRADASAGPARIRLSIDAAGRVVDAAAVDEPDDAATRRWQRCAMRALARAHFAGGGAGVLEVLATWELRDAATGNMIGTPVEGVGGLGLPDGARGTGGGGTGEGIGAGTFGSFARDTEPGAGASGVGTGRGGLRRDAPTPGVRLGDPEVRGALSRDVLRRVVRMHHAEIRGCYERAQAAAPTLAGRLQVSFTIAADGHVSEVSISQETIGAEVATCVANAIRGWAFPRLESGGVVVVSYPFLFSPS